MLIKNARGTTRDIEPNQLNEYKRRGYTEVIVEVVKEVKNPEKKTSKTIANEK